MFYRLPFPNQSELERLIKGAKCETQMIDFRSELRDDLNTPRALKEFESGWDKYWREMQSQKRAAASRGQPAKSMKVRIRSETPPTSEENSSEGHGADKGEPALPAS
jgi:cysteinyl-tRNA synthetase